MKYKKLNNLKKRILEISYKHQLSHLGSCISAVEIIDEIYRKKHDNEKFILSAGHAALALYVVNEWYYKIDAEKTFQHHGVHPDRCKKCRLDCSTGSLGQGLPIALGIALANRKKKVYCLISDGECAEGSVWETLRLKSDLKVNNLKVYVNINGWGAYGSINKRILAKRLKSFASNIFLRYTTVNQLPFLKGQSAHYHIMNENDYHLAELILK